MNILSKKEKMYVYSGIAIALFIVFIFIVNMPMKYHAYTNDIVRLDDIDDKAFLNKDMSYLVGYKVYNKEVIDRAMKGRENPMYFLEIIEVAEDGESVDIDGYSFSKEDMDQVGDFLDQHNKGYQYIYDGVVKGYNKKTGQIEEVDISNIFDNYAYYGLPLDKQHMIRSSKFGVRNDELIARETGVSSFYSSAGQKGSVAFHTGVDYSSSNIHGANVYSVAPGKIKDIQKSNSGYGNLVIIDHGKFETYYAHLDSIANIKIGSRVGTGDVIGKVGSTGRSTGPHLHFEVNIGDVAINPEILINYINTGKLQDNSSLPEYNWNTKPQKPSTSESKPTTNNTNNTNKPSKPSKPKPEDTITDLKPDIEDNNSNKQEIELKPISPLKDIK